MGGVCRGWEEDIYWTHFQFIHFTQFLRSDFHQQLALPKTFSNNIKKNLPESVTLKGPAGMLWNIELTTKGDTLYFTHGWQQFMKEHSLKENDFLVFKYNGESLFEVLIFDGGSLCEKAACYFVRKCWQAVNTEQGGGCSGRKRDSDNSVEEVKTPNGVDEDVSPEKSLHVNSIRVPIDVPVETTNGKTSNAGVESAPAEQFMSDAVTDTEPKTVPSKITGKRTRRKPVYADMSVPIKKRGRPAKPPNSHKRAHDCVSGVELSPKVSPKASPKVGFRTKELYTSNRRPVTKNEIENTLQLAQATCAEDTLLVTMRPTHVYKRFFVSFPNKWRINHLSPSSQDVILRMGKSEWLGKYRYHNIRNNGGLTGGWKYFALENNLEEFDVCLFKPAGYMDKTLILEITIFRVVEEITPLTAVNSPQKKSSIKKTPTGLNSREKKSSFKKTPTSAVQTELESFEPLVKKRGVNITVTSAVQTELDSIEGA
ncbi:unnamed protein product [Vicia faba]|uniref:TF-B3 domain-containing protein n=1 Tax=Vicia faba TaxID=3906 RepID=A0AAV0YI56_VICFA|nr:unnamed protein product [Vicia faba]